MKKIYTLLTLFVASLFGIAAQAETRTVTFYVDDATHLEPVQRYSSDITMTFDENNALQVTFGESFELSKLVFNAAEGYKISSLLKADGTEFSSSWTVYPNPNKNPQTRVEFAGYDSYDGFFVEEGQEIYIKTTKVESKIFTFKGNPEHIKYAYVGSKYVYMDESGELSYDVTDVYTFYLYLNDDCVLNTVTDEEGNEVTYTYNSNYNYISIKPSDFEGSTTFNVSSTSNDDLRTASITVNIDGDPADIVFKRDGKTIDLKEKTSVIKFNPETETSFTSYRTNDYETFYKLIVDYKEISPEGYYNEYNFTVSDGSVVNIIVDVPVSDIDVPVTFDFTNPGTQDALLGLQVVKGEQYTAEECLQNRFTLKMGSQFGVMCDESKYDVDIYFNGTYSSTGVGTIDNESGYVITITASKIATKDITIKCDAWESIKVTDDYSTNIPLTGAETVVSFRILPDYLKIRTYDGYELNSVIEEASGKDVLELDYPDEGKVRDLKDGMTITINASKFTRDQEMVIFLENVEWKRQDFYLNQRDKEEHVTLEIGYNHLMFGPGDFEYAYFGTMAPVEGEMVMYLNDEKVEMEENYWNEIVPVGLDKIKAGDVLKIYAEEKDTHTVTYHISDDVNATVYHDHVVAIESPATHTVLPGTEIHIKPAMAMARAAATGLSVMVNDQAIEPGADGIFTVTADGDKEIKIKNDPSTSIAEIGAENASKVYDLMGRRVNANHRGLTIVNGKKVMK